jgi:glycosyltransferase involved in cell wall biosynthesis
MAVEIARLADAQEEMQRLRQFARAAAPQFSREHLAARMIEVLSALANRGRLRSG